MPYHLSYSQIIVSGFLRTAKLCPEKMHNWHKWRHKWNYSYQKLTYNFKSCAAHLPPYRFSQGYYKNQWGNHLYIEIRRFWTTLIDSLISPKKDARWFERILSILSNSHPSLSVLGKNYEEWRFVGMHIQEGMKRGEYEIIAIKM